MTDPADEILQLLGTIDGEGEGLVGGADRLEALLSAKGLMHEQRIAPRNVGFHPRNRDGEGGNPLEVLRLASEVAEVGFSLKEVRHALCIQAEPGDKTIETFNAKLVANTGIAPVERDSILYGSLSAGHLNGALRCIGASVASTCKFLSEGGKMSLDKVRRRSPLYADAVEHGLCWKVLHWEVLYLYPQALEVISTARNITASLARGETEMQGLLRLHALSATAQKNGEEPPWATIKTAIRRSKPAYEGSLDHMASFVITRSGGVNGKFLQYLSAFHRNHVGFKERRALPATVYAALAEFPLHYVAIALFCAAWRCPKEAVVNGVCKGVTASDINNLAKLTDAQGLARLRSAEAALAASRCSLGACGIRDEWDTTVLCKTLARLDIQMARLVLDKQIGAGRKITSVSDVMRVFVEDLAAAYPKADLATFGEFLEASVAAAETAKTAKEEMASAKTAAGSMPLYEVAMDGAVVDPLARLRAKGLDLGSHVAQGLEEMAAVHQILRLEPATIQQGPRVVLADLRGENRTFHLPLQEFLSKWTARDLKHHHEEVAHWGARRPKNLEAGQSLMRRAWIQAALDHLAATADCAAEDKVTLWSKPKKMAMTAAPCEAGELLFFPETTVLKTRPRVDEEDAPLRCSTEEVEIRFHPRDDAFQHFAMPMPAASDMHAPLWYVAPTGDEEAANMAWTTARVQLLSAHFFQDSLRPARARATAANTAGGSAEGDDDDDEEEAEEESEDEDGEEEESEEEVEEAAGGTGKGGKAKPKARSTPKAKAKAPKAKAKKKAAAPPKAKAKTGRAAAPKPKAKGKASAQLAEGLAEKAGEKKPEEFGEDLAGERSIAIPVLINTKPLAANTPLKFFKAASVVPEKRAKEAAPLSVSAIMKRYRTT